MPDSYVENQYNYCPRCGADNPAPGSLPFKCTRCDFANFFGPVAAVGGLVTPGDGRLLLVRRARDPGKGKWGLPGGFVDRHECVEDALVREILEETQLQVSRLEFLTTRPNQYNYHGIVSPVIDLFYVCEVEASCDLTLAEDELEHFEWARPTAEHLENMAFQSNREAIEYWMTQSRG